MKSFTIKSSELSGINNPTSRMDVGYHRLLQALEVASADSGEVAEAWEALLSLNYRQTEAQVITQIRAAGPLVIARQAAIRKIMGVTETSAPVEKGIKTVAEFSIKQEVAEIDAEISKLKERKEKLKPKKEVKRKL